MNIPVKLPNQWCFLWN